VFLMLLAVAFAAALAQSTGRASTGTLVVRLNIAPSCVVAQGQATCRAAGRDEKPLAVRREADPAAPGRQRLTIEY
jgi:hypothetical protein